MADHFLTPHVQLQEREETQLALAQHQSTAFSSLSEAEATLLHINTVECPRLSQQIKGLNQHAVHVNRIQSKLIEIHRRLRAVRRQLVEAGIEIEGEPDPVAEIEREDMEEINRRREEAKQKRLAAAAALGKSTTLQTPPTPVVVPTAGVTQVDSTSNRQNDNIGNDDHGSNNNDS